MGKRASRSRGAGQAMVEFALVAPIFFILMFAIIEGARFAFYYEMLNSATRDGARYAIVHGSNALDGCPERPAGAGHVRLRRAGRQRDAGRQQRGDRARRQRIGHRVAACLAVDPGSTEPRRSEHWRQPARQLRHGVRGLHLFTDHPASPLDHDQREVEPCHQQLTADEQGQVLVIFALSLLTLLLFAALAFDTGVMLLERRDQQNAADAAALAGARYLPGSTVDAESAARSLATANGFTDGVDTATVDVTFPSAGRIKVEIGSTRASIFGGILGRVGWGVAASAVAANEDDVGAPFAMLSLDPHGCDALFVSGNGEVISNGNIQVNSDCANGALKRRAAGPSPLPRRVRRATSSGTSRMSAPER